MQVQNFRNGGSSFHPLQPCFLFICDLDLDFRYSRLIYRPQTVVQCVGANDEPDLNGVHALFLLGQVRSYRIRGMDRLVLRPTS